MKREIKIKFVFETIEEFTNEEFVAGVNQYFKDALETDDTTIYVEEIKE